MPLTLSSLKIIENSWGNLRFSIDDCRVEDVMLYWLLPG
jgi:hypothetical protein